MNTWDGVHIDNDMIYDMAEDIDQLEDDIEHWMDPRYPLTAEGIKIDAELRFSPNAQKLLKMLMKDLDINSFEDLENAAEKIVGHMERDFESCPYAQRMRKAVERMVRFAMQNTIVTDLPNSGRVRWVDELTRDLYRVMKRGDSIEELHEMAGDLIEDFIEEAGEYAE